MIRDRVKLRKGRGVIRTVSLSALRPAECFALTLLEISGTVSMLGRYF